LPTIGPQATGHRPQRCGRVSEPRGDAFEGFVIDNDRAERLVLALEGLTWLEEESLDVAPIHDVCSLPLIIFRPETAAERTAKTEVEKGSKRPSGWREP
jgi:hypothetical protein